MVPDFPSDGPPVGVEPAIGGSPLHSPSNWAAHGGSLEVQFKKLDYICWPFFLDCVVCMDWRRHGAMMDFAREYREFDS